ncbi:MAG: hypothetical protein FJZ01_28500, partial [Candidatus Sericytochromatia bacterium]|nr:hypothetical protein [Candidatus Tanganyikabacteria bacterium]
GAGGAAHLPHAAGAAWAARLRGEPAVALASCNHGAASSGEFHAALNFAGVFSAPVLFVCRRRSESPVAFPPARQAGGKAREAVVPAAADGGEPSIAPRAKGYGMPGVLVDGTDLLALIGALGAAVARARAGEGPTLVEAALGGRDPLELLRRHLVFREAWTDAQEREAGAEHEAAVQAAIRAAAAAGPPAPETLLPDSQD